MSEARREQWETNLPWRVQCVESRDQPEQLLDLQLSEMHIQQILERAGSPSRSLLLQPPFWVSYPVCDGVMGNKTNKNSPKQTHTLSSLLLVLLPLSKPYTLKEMMPHPQRYHKGCWPGGTSHPMGTHSTGLPQTHPFTLFSPFRIFLSLCATLLL